MFKLIPNEIREAFAKEDKKLLNSIMKRIMDFYGIKKNELVWESVFREKALVALIPFPTFSGPQIYHFRNPSKGLRGPNVFQKFNCVFWGGKSFGGIPVISPYDWWLFVKPHMSSKGMQIFLRDNLGISRSVRWMVWHEAVAFENWRDYDVYIRDRGKH